MLPSRRAWLPLLLALGLTGAAWLAVLAGWERVGRLDLSRFEPADGNSDVVDALRRDGQVARHLLPYTLAAVGLDVAALVALVWSDNRPGRLLASLAWAVWLLSAGWHAFGLFVARVMAG